MTHHSDDAPLIAGSSYRPTAVCLARTISLVLCALVIVLLAVFPGVIVRDDALLAQALMPVILAALGAGLAHGFGFVPRDAAIARLIGPVVSWPLMLSALAFLILRTAE